MPLSVVFLLLPLAEIAGFVLIGGWLGVGLTLLWVIGAALAGVLLLRRAGEGAARAAMGGLRDPARAITGEALTAMAAILLIVPGFLTDAAAILLLLPPVRAALVRRIAARRRSAHR